MAEPADSLILEIHRDTDTLKMCLAGRGGPADTVRHYSRRRISGAQISSLSRGVSSLLENAGRALDPGTVEELRRGGMMLWDQLLTPAVKAGLNAARGGHLLLLLDEEISAVPWELVFDGREFLSLKFSTGRVVASGSRCHTPARRPGNTLRMLIMADPTQDLPRAYQEGVHIRRGCDRLRNRRICVDFKSGHIDTLYVRKSMREYDVVHFAGHCERPGEGADACGWVLADGMFTAGDIAALAGESSMPALVFSNSCHSAEGGARDENLASAFLLSGVRHYLAPLYRLDDSGGAMFAAEFYARIFAGVPLGEAVRGARQALIGSQGIGTVSWAQYVLYGDPGFVLPLPAQAPEPLPVKKAAVALAVSAACALMLFAAVWRFGPADRFALHSARRHYACGRNAEAARLCGEIARRGKLAEAHLLMAEALQRMGRSEEAIRKCFDYMAACGDAFPERSVDTCIKIGSLYLDSGDYVKSRQFYEKALEQSRAAGYKMGESTALRRLAVWHMDKGDDDHALELLTKSLEIDRERQHLPAHRYNLACDYFDMGLCFENKDENDTAKEFYAKSMELFRKMRLRHEESDYYFNVGEIYILEKQYQKALESYLQGLRIDLALDNKPSIAVDYDMLGELYLEMECQDKAEEYFLKSLSIARQIRSRPAIASACLNLGTLYRKKRSKMSAREHLKQAQEIYLSMGTPDLEEVKEEFRALEE